MNRGGLATPTPPGDASLLLLLLSGCERRDSLLLILSDMISNFRIVNEPTTGANQDLLFKIIVR
jgi:hypothetical protein